MKVGTFTKDQDGTIFGKIQALGLGNVEAVFEQRTSKKGEPFYKVIADPAGNPFEIGSAWPKVKDGLYYLSVSLDTVFAAMPINAALFPDKNDSNAFNLVWNKPSVAPKAEVKTDTKAETQDETQLPITPPVAAKAGTRTAERQTPRRHSNGMSTSL